MPRSSARLLSVALAVLFLPGSGLPAQSADWERALAAFRSGQYPAAIRICEASLAAAPADYDFGFLLARALGASGQYEKAAVRAEALLAGNPRNTDVLSLMARIRLWQGNLPAAEEGFRSVLGIDPKNVEAWMGLADAAMARGDAGRALEACQSALRAAPPTADVYYHLGRVYRLRGEIRTAKTSFGEALRLEPGNADYRRAYEQTDPGLQAGTEIRYTLRSERFSGAVEGYAVHQAAFQFPAPGGLGPAVLKLNQTRRYGRGDTQFGGELYPRLWRRAYGSLDVSVDPSAVYFPSLSARLEVYQGAFDAAEFSLGYWHIAFPTETVNVYLGSAAYYLGSYYAVLRLTHNPAGGGSKTSWMAQVRRYFSDISYVFIGYGRGERPFELGTIEDLLVHRSWALLAGARWHLRRTWKLEISFGRVADDRGLRRDTVALSTGYRW